MSIIQQRLPSGFNLNSSKALSPTARAHCRDDAVSGLDRTPTILHYPPIYGIQRGLTLQSRMGRTYNKGVRETKVDRICAFDAFDLFR
jgi:hypothetical protein